LNQRGSKDVILNFYLASFRSTYEPVSSQMSIQLSLCVKTRDTLQQRWALQRPRGFKPVDIQSKDLWASYKITTNGIVDRWVIDSAIASGGKR